MIKVKSFTTQLKIFHAQQELDDLDKAVNGFIASHGVRKVISAGDASTAGSQGESIGLIRLLVYEDPSANAREKYQEKVEDTLREWGEDIEMIRKKAEKMGAAAKERYGKQIEDLHARQETARRKLDEVKKSGEEAWEEFRKGADKALEELRKAKESAFDKIRGK